MAIKALFFSQTSEGIEFFIFKDRSDPCIDKRISESREEVKTWSVGGYIEREKGREKRKVQRDE